MLRPRSHTDTGLVVARVANTPGEAKVLVALLQAEGIPAHVDGESLADEVAMSRRAMNLNGVRVLVPGSHLELAKEVLASTAVPDAELEAQALAAAPEPDATGTADPSRGDRRVLLMVIAVAVAALLVMLWRSRKSEARPGR